MKNDDGVFNLLCLYWEFGIGVVAEAKAKLHPIQASMMPTWAMQWQLRLSDPDGLLLPTEAS